MYKIEGPSLHDYHALHGRFHWSALAQGHVDIFNTAHVLDEKVIFKDAILQSLMPLPCRTLSAHWLHALEERTQDLRSAMPLASQQTAAQSQLLLYEPWVCCSYPQSWHQKWMLGKNSPQVR